MLSMVWQFVVLPGAHTVTVVNRVLTSGLVLEGPPLTTTLATLGPVGAELPEEPLDPEELPDPEEPLDPDERPVLPPLLVVTPVLPVLPSPPQESIGKQRTAHSARRQGRDGATVRMNLTISVNPRC
jgi:hypothetical protein